MNMKKFHREQAIIAARQQLSPLGNAAAILGWHSEECRDPLLAKELKAAARLATQANRILNVMLRG